MTFKKVRIIKKGTTEWERRKNVRRGGERKLKFTQGLRVGADLYRIGLVNDETFPQGILHSFFLLMFTSTRGTAHHVQIQGTDCIVLLLLCRRR